MIVKAIKCVALALAGLVAAAAVVLYVYRDIPAATLEAQYARPPSRFLRVDGIRFHYRDEGHGPAIVLIHEEFDSLLMWDPWAAALKDKYRVIRFDLTSHGLTDSDPTGDYSLERTVTLFEHLVDQLGLGEFALAGSAHGGTVAMYYAARHPERVDRLILVSPQGVHARGVRKQAALMGASPAMIDLLAYAAPRLFAAGLLRSGFGDPSRVTDALVDQRYILLRREGNRRGELARIRQFDPIDIQRHLRALRPPVLIMSGDKNRYAASGDYEWLRRLLTRAHSVRIDVIRGAGSMAVREDPEGTARRAREFLDAGHGVASPEPRPDPRERRYQPQYELQSESQYLTRAA